MRLPLSLLFPAGFYTCTFLLFLGSSETSHVSEEELATPALGRGKGLGQSCGLLLLRGSHEPWRVWSMVSGICWAGRRSKSPPGRAVIAPLTSGGAQIGPSRSESQVPLHHSL